SRGVSTPGDVLVGRAREVDATPHEPRDRLEVARGERAGGLCCCRAVGVTGLTVEPLADGRAVLVREPLAEVDLQRVSVDRDSVGVPQDVEVERADLVTLEHVQRVLTREDPVSGTDAVPQRAGRVSVRERTDRQFLVATPRLPRS